MKTTIKTVSTIALASAFLVACQATPSTNTQSQQLSYSILKNYNWQLIEAKDANNQNISALMTQPSAPLTLNFVYTDGRNILSLENTCNRYSADYTVNDGNVNVGNFATTMMACPTAQAEFDRASANAVMGNYSLNKTITGSPVLTITNNGQVAHFKAVPKS